MKEIVEVAVGLPVFKTFPVGRSKEVEEGIFLSETGEEELDFGLAKGFLNFDCLLG
jgi:hypothetical protein